MSDQDDARFDEYDRRLVDVSAKLGFLVAPLDSVLVSSIGIWQHISPLDKRTFLTRQGTALSFFCALMCKKSFPKTSQQIPRLLTKNYRTITDKGNGSQ